MLAQVKLAPTHPRGPMIPSGHTLKPCHRDMARPRRQATAIGFTLVELLIGVAILGVLLALAAPSLADFINRRRVETVAAELATDLAYTKTEVVARTEDVFIRFNSNSEMTCYSITYLSGIGSCDCRRAAGTSCGGGLSSAYELKLTQLRKSLGVTMTPSMTYSPFGFSPPLMTPSHADFYVTVAGSRGSTLLVKVNPAGRISTCSPSGSGNIPGYQICPAASN